VRVLGVDLGVKRIGVARSDATGTLASPLVVLDRTPDLHRRLSLLVVEEEAALVVIGLPRGLDGRDGKAAKAVRAEVVAIERALPVPVVLCDERLTTVVAHSGLAAGGRSAKQRRGMVDAAAAAVILQSWLDSPEGRRRRDTPNDSPNEVETL
jgi:putative Holliday junction resolvase